jgi:hypothetical protein
VLSPSNSNIGISKYFEIRASLSEGNVPFLNWFIYPLEKPKSFSIRDIGIFLFLHIFFTLSTVDIFTPNIFRGNTKKC